MKWVWRILAGLLTVVMLAAAGLYAYLRTGLPEMDGTYALNSPQAPVQIIRDSRAVPHIFAANEPDAFFALGFLHAQDRLWQMEMTRRIGSGRLAETLPIGGDFRLRVDRLMRVFDLPGRAQRSYAALSPEMTAQVDAYAEGINAWLAERDGALPPEYLALGIEPEPWEPWQSLLWPQLMALQLSGDYRSELARAAVLEALGPAAVADLWPANVGTEPATLGPDGRGTGTGDGAGDGDGADGGAAGIDEAGLRDLLGPGAARRLLAALPPALGPRTASNEWAVDGRHTETGAPILANDPHLGLESPILWYLARIETPTLTLTGATVPGVPMLLLGHNGHIAWGFTTTGGDVQDLVVERVDPDDPTRYLTPDGPVPFETREEVIEVRGGEPVTLTVRETRHGPVISDIDDRAAGHAAGRDGGDHVLALSYTGLVDIDTTPDAAYRLNRARSWEEFVDAMALWVAPQQNVIYADTGGRIGIFTPGRVPVRRAGDGSLPVPGWDGAYGWDGRVPLDALPQAVDPADGRLVNANNAIVGPGFPHLIARSYDEGYRAERILEMLEDEGMGATVATHEGMLADTVSLAARDVLPLMLDRVTAPDAATADLLARLRRWDHRMDRHEAEPLVFMAWFTALHDALYADELGDLADSAPSLAPTVIKRMLTERTAWCDDVSTAATEDCADAVDRALDTALTDLVDRYGEDPAEWRWGDAHTAPLGNQIWSRLPVIAGLVSNAVETHGGHFTVNRGGFYGADDDRPFAHTHGAGFRAVYDLSDLANSRFVIATGQSGHPMSPHWGDFVQMWAAGGHTTIAGDPETIAETGRGTITLEPR